MAAVTVVKDIKERTPKRGGNGRAEWDLRGDKFEEMVAVANEAQGRAMMWMAPVMETRAEEAEHRMVYEGGNGGVGAGHAGWSGGDGNGIGFVGKDGPWTVNKQDWRERGQVEECWVRRGGGLKCNPRWRARIDRGGRTDRIREGLHD